MTNMDDDIAAMIADRNALRQQAGLPQLDAGEEVARIVATREQLAFDLAFEQHLAAMNPEWLRQPGGWMTRLGRWAQARREFRAAYDITTET